MRVRTPKKILAFISTAPAVQSPQAQATEIKIAADHILKTRERINRILAENMGKPIEFVERETERDNFLTAEEAVEYGLADKIIYNR